MTLLRIVLLAGILLVCAAFDGAWLSRMPRWASPDLLLLVVVALGLRQGIEAGALAGAAAGYLRDLTGGGPLGIYAFSYLGVGVAAGALAAVVDLRQKRLYATASALAAAGLVITSGLVVATSGIGTFEWSVLLRGALSATVPNALLASPVAAVVAWAEAVTGKREMTRIVARRAIK